MTFEEIRRRVQTTTGVDAGALYALFQEESGSDDLDRFVHFLFEQEVIDEALLGELLTTQAVELRTEVSEAPPAPATRRRYELLGPLGRGAMGEVFVARDVDLRRKVAFKTLAAEVAARAEVRERFVDEVQITSQLDHPGIVPVYGLEATVDGRVAYAMKWVRGRELADVLEEARSTLDAGEPLPEELTRPQRIEHLVRVCEALRFAHARGIIHRDLKPANIMVGRFGEVYVMDWGIARAMAGAERDRDLDEEEVPSLEQGRAELQRTRIGRVLGTPLFMSPEQARGENDALDGRSDQYSLGLVLQAVATLRRPIGGDTLKEVIAHATKGERIALEAYPGEPRIERELRAIIDRATALEPSERYPDVGAFADDLRRFLRGEAVEASPDNVLQRLGRWTSRHRGATVGIIFTLLLLGLAATVTAGTIAREQQALAREQEVLTREQRVVAQLHREEEARAGFLTAASDASHRLDAELHRIEAMVERLVGAAKALSAHPTRRRSDPRDGAWFDGQTASLIRSPHYARPVSLQEPVVVVPPELSPWLVQAELGRLTWLTPTLRHVLLETADPDYEDLPDEAQDRLVVDGAGTVHRVFVTMADGVHVSFPGRGGVEGDARKLAPYRQAEARRGPQWGAPYPDRLGTGRLFACSVAMQEGASVLGVAGVEVSLERVAARYLTARPGVTLALVDASGTPMLDAPLPAHAPDAVRAAIRDRSSTVVPLDGKRFAAIYAVEATGWFYVAIADAEELAERQTPP